MKTYYKVLVNEHKRGVCKYSLYNDKKYLVFKEMTPELEEIIKTHKARGYWSYNPQDWGECLVNVKVVKITEEEL